MANKPPLRLLSTTHLCVCVCTSKQVTRRRKRPPCTRSSHSLENENHLPYYPPGNGSFWNPVPIPPPELPELPGSGSHDDGFGVEIYYGRVPVGARFIGTGPALASVRLHQTRGRRRRNQFNMVTELKLKKQQRKERKSCWHNKVHIHTHTHRHIWAHTWLQCTHIYTPVPDGGNISGPVAWKGSMTVWSVLIYTHPRKHTQKKRKTTHILTNGKNEWKI